MPSRVAPFLLGIVVLLAGVGCSKVQEGAPNAKQTPREREEVSAHGAPSPSSAPPSPSTDATSSSALRWDVPASWTKAQNRSPMRLATYAIPKAPSDGEDGDLSVSRAQGGTSANIERWVGQFEGGRESLKSETRQTRAGKVTWVEIRGAFNGNAMLEAHPSGPRPGYELLAAIVEGANPPYFFKLVGPQKTLDLARSDFEKLISSLHYE
jgi:hypothetical protein